MQKLPRKSCLNCGKPCKRATTKYCSNICKGKQFRGKRIGGKQITTNIPRECPTCKIVFLPNNYKVKQKYCSYRCSGLARAEECRQLGLKQKGRLTSQETRNKQSIAAANRPSFTQFTKGKGGIRDDIGHYVRSSWEANFSRILNLHKIRYSYEPKIFPLKAGEITINYKPDFLVEGSYIEIKGWWNKKSLLIKELFEKQYPDIHIIYISEKEYAELKNKYKSRIPEWE